MLGRDQYVPILTGKLGEFRALQRLTPEIVHGLVPFIDMPPITPNGPPKDGVPAERDPPALKLRRLITAVGAKWGTDRRVMVDLAAYDRYEIQGKHPACWLFREAASHGIWLMAAAGTDSSDRYRAALHDCADVLKGICLRARADPDAAPTDLAAAIDDLAASLPTCDPAHTVLMLDLRRIADHGGTAAELLELVRAHLRALHARGRAVSALAGTSMPERPVARGAVHRERRREWRLWQALEHEPLARNASFSDYGITGPRPDDDEWTGPPDPHLRYTTAAALLLWRGRLEERAGDPANPQERAVLFPELCAELVDRDDFAGRDFSAGDSGIWDAARVSHKPGTGTKWIEFATNHHLTHVVRQLRRAG
jgi:T4 beta protein